MCKGERGRERERYIERERNLMIDGLLAEIEGKEEDRGEGIREKWGGGG